MNTTEPITPATDGVIPIRIGVKPHDDFEARNAASDIKLKDTRRPARAESLRFVDIPQANADDRVDLAGAPSGKTFDGPSLLVGASGQPLSASTEPSADLVDVRGETLTSLTWKTYQAWRKTKCMPRDLGHKMVLFPEMSEIERYEWPRQEWIEEIDQATLELIGEVAELGELFLEHGPTMFFGNLREKLIDECGDILFCANWAFDAWGYNPLSDSDDLELLRVSDDSELAAFANVLAANQMHVVVGNARFVSMLGGMVFNLMLTAQTNAGLTANAFKKLRFQRREQPVEVQIGRIANVLVAVNQLLVVANSNVEEALKVNIRKLDTRYPDGYKPGQGGGVRTGEGK